MMSNFVDDVIKIDLQQWADSRETSLAIVQAIRDMSDTEAEMQDLWEDPTGQQRTRIIETARRYAPNHIGLYWGASGMIKE